MNKFEKKIIDVKNKIGQKNLGIIYFSIFCIVGIIAMMQVKQYKIQNQKIQDSYNRAMYDFVSDTNNIEAEIAKLKVTASDNYTLTTLASIFAKANSANSNLDLLPFSQSSIANVSKFLNQLSDFSYSLMRNILNGDNIEEYKDEIDNMYSKINELSNVVEEIYTQLNTNAIMWNELENIGNEKIKEADANEEVSSVNKIGKTFTEYEGIIYDGAFSNHVLTREPAFLNGEMLSEKQVEDELRRKLDIQEINFKYEQESSLPLYVYEVKLNGEDLVKTIYATKQDGKIFQIISNRNVDREIIGIEDANKAALEFFANIGIDNLVSTYYIKSDNTITISYAAIQDDVVIYSDLIKIKIALDNGEILGLETNGYIYNHRERTISTSKTASEARECLYKDLNIKSEKLCIIPTDSKNEVVTYEFEGSIDDKRFLVYINANTLVEEKIYIVLEDENGITTI